MGANHAITNLFLKKKKSKRDDSQASFIYRYPFKFTMFKALIYGGKSPYGDNVSAKQNVITRTNFRPEQPPSWIAEPKDPGNEVLS